MKKLPEVNVSFQKLYRMFVAPIKSKLLLTGIELKVFNELTGPTSADIVAQVIGSDHPENTMLLLDGLASIGLVVKKDGLYQNTPIAQAFLVEGSPTYLGQFFTNQLQWHKPVIDNLSTLVMEGPPPKPEMGAESEEVWAQMATTMANYERSGIAQQMAEIISQLPEFPSLKKMLDLGGGPGLIGMAIVAAHPSMKGVVFDRPAIVKVAQKFIREYEMEDRMEALGGDYTNDSVGEGYDLVLACATLNFVKDDLDEFLKKIYDALNPGGVFIAFSDGLTHERTKPEIMVTTWLSMALTGQDMGFEQGFIADSILRVGFKSVRSRTLDTPMGPMDLEIGRKAQRPSMLYEEESS
jgi:predicted O-methyltransferase YrrM